jgi:hypothetical protein
MPGIYCDELRTRHRLPLHLGEEANAGALQTALHYALAQTRPRIRWSDHPTRNCLRPTNVS